MSTNIIVAKNQSEFLEGKRLFEEYADGLGIDLGFQNFAEELAQIEVQYGSPYGGLLLIDCDGILSGCAGVRKWSDGIAELKRMYIRDEHRGKGLGKLLMTEALELSVRLGYYSIRLDTIPSMQSAIALYRTFGFVEIPPYRLNPVEGTLYFEKQLL